jgi:DNA polymerase-3 subunit epsilon
MNAFINQSPLSYSTPIAQVPFVYLDVETTGMEPEMGDRICELGMIKAVNGEMISEFQELIHPGRKISAEASAVNKITDAMVVGKPYFKQLAPRIREFIDNSVLVIHNAPFDLGFLAVQYGVLGYPRLNNPTIDTLKLARKFYRFPGNRLSDIGRAFKIKADGYHRASKYF